MAIHAVNGLISPEELGPTLTHEHVSMTFDFSFRAPKESEAHLTDCAWSLANSGWIQQWPYSHKDNLNFADQASQAAVIDSLKRFKANGGGCIVENSTFGLHRKSEFLLRLAQETGVAIVAGTGHYVAPAQSQSDLDSLTVESMTGHIQGELEQGAFDCAQVKCGFIGEIGCSYPLHAFA